MALSLIRGEPLVPLGLRLRGPTSSEMVDRFDEVRRWINDIERGAEGGYRVLGRQVNHRLLGHNVLPDEILFEDEGKLLAFIGKKSEARRLLDLADEAAERLPALLLWLERRPLRALEEADKWPRLLDLTRWLLDHPRPGLYLRQVDLPAIDSKFIEANRALLCELFDLVLPPEAIDDEAQGLSGFARRFGFRDKPLLVRFRLLDPSCSLLPTATDQDLTVTASTFAALDLDVGPVFIVENEITFLSFPPVARGLALFGSGYGFEALHDATWLDRSPLFYWSDLDSHGFAMLDQLRSRFPRARSLLMDRKTLMDHRPLWGKEPRPQRRDLTRLDEAESALYDDLRQDRLAPSLRLEQERIGYGALVEALEAEKLHPRH